MKDDVELKKSQEKQKEKLYQRDVPTSDSTK